MHEYFLHQALAQAHLRRGFCTPNPAVGAVLVKDNEIIATGYHWAAGCPHAEREAITKAQMQAVGATLYVTLEPCCHWGRTPPCTDIIIAQGIREVYFSYIDPNPAVAGQAVALLRKAGIICEQINLPEIEQFYRSYAHWAKTKRPWITAKLALSLDGKIAGSQGEPLKISGSELQQVTHQYRLQADAILTTARTLKQDNPQLNVRINKEVFVKPIYVLDRCLTSPLSLTIFQTGALITLFHNAAVSAAQIAAFTDKGIRCVPIAEANGELDLHEIIKFVGAEGVHDLWVEAGGRCFESLLHQQLLSSAKIYVAPKILGEKGYSAFKFPYDFMPQAKTCRWQQVGSDVMVEMDFI